MKNVSLWSGALVVAVTVAGCHTPSVQGIATAEHIEYDGHLLGVWFSDDVRFELTEGENRRYVVNWAEGDERGPELEAAIVRVGEYRVVDATLSADELDELNELRDGYYQGFVLPVHYLMRLDVEEGRLTLAFIDQDWLEEELGRGRVDHYEMDEDPILTAGPDDLRQLLARAFRTDGAMDDETLVLTRTREE